MLNSRFLEQTVNFGSLFKQYTVSASLPSLFSNLEDDADLSSRKGSGSSPRNLMHEMIQDELWGRVTVILPDR